MSMPENCVAVARAAKPPMETSPSFGGAGGGAAQEVALGSPYDLRTISRMLTRLFVEAGWDAANVGTASWNPLGEVIQPGSKVLIKPNLVLHQNFSGSGLECLITNRSVLHAVLDFVVKARPGQIVVGDAPIQGCDMPRLMAEGGFVAVQEQFNSAGTSVQWKDFRRSVLLSVDGVEQRHEELRPLDAYVLFDLGSTSLLEPISGDAKRFRVTMYNPDLMRAMHAPGRHKYLIAGDALDADVVINLPKLKTHKKGAITGALKNLVGINGDKDYLPHHRRGGSDTGGDCYPGGNRLKMLAELFTDASNRRAGRGARLLHQGARFSKYLAKLTGADGNLEGSWYGNDTVWRMCLDLNRILLYGRSDGTLADQRQRTVLTITDAVVCGEGEGPLAPTPHHLGVLTLAQNPAAADLVHASLMGFDWRKVPIVREAFGRFEYPICTFPPEAVEVLHEGRRISPPWPTWSDRAFTPPEGWMGHCETPAVA